MSRLRPPVQLAERQRLVSQHMSQTSCRLAGVIHEAAAQTVLEAAHRLVVSRRGGSTSGPDGVDPTILDKDALVDLGARLRSGEHRHAEPRYVEVPKQTGGHRRIAVQDAVDRVADTAVALAIRPIIDADLPDCSFGFRRGFGTYQALGAAGRLITDFKPGEVLLRTDVADCFSSITWDKLLPSLERRFIDPLLFGFIEDLLAGKGVPQGSPLAPALVDCHLTPLLQDLADHGRGLMFGDDLLAICGGADEAVRSRIAWHVPPGSLVSGSPPPRRASCRWRRGFHFSATTSRSARGSSWPKLHRGHFKRSTLGSRPC